MRIGNGALVVALAALVVAPLRAQQQQGAASVRLTMPAMERAAQAARALKEASASDPSVIVDLDDDTPIEQDVARFEHSPATMAVLRKVGITPREYLTTIFAYAESMAVVVLQQSSPGYKAPPNVSAENVAFIRAHQAELQKLLPQGDDE